MEVERKPDILDAKVKLKEKVTEWKLNALDKKIELIRAFDEQLSALIDDIADSEDSEPDSFSTKTLGSLANEYSNSSPANKLKTRSEGLLKKKEFRLRNSVLTDLLNSSHIRSVYHIFVAILIIICLNTSVSDVVETGSLIHFYHFQHVAWAFGGTNEVISTWLCMQLSALSIYPAFFFWYHNRIPVRRVTTFDACFGFMYCIFLFAFFILPAQFITSSVLPPASSLIIAMEQIRMMMKMHAFIRENIPKALSKKEKVEDSGDQEEDGCPNFSKYLYFFFAPTLVYRDEYPRTKSIRWQYVVSNFAQVVACITYMYYMFARFCVPHFRNFDSKHVTAERLVVSTFKCMLPAAVILFIGFFGVLHSWLNAFAEMLKFGDRQFYTDWWNSRNFGQFYRTWNIVVHDWLYSYIYSDVYQAVSRHLKRPVAMASVFIISAIVHEYIIIISFRFFYPVLFVMFLGAGFAFIFIRGTHRLWNVFLWVALFSGTGILMCLYSMEWYAQKNCRMILPNSAWDVLIPRSWFCIRR